jgi:hypothetical protein
LQRFEKLHRIGGFGDERAVRFSEFGFQTITRLLCLGSRVYRAPNFAEQSFDRPEGSACDEPL